MSGKEGQSSNSSEIQERRLSRMTITGNIFTGCNVGFRQIDMDSQPKVGIKKLDGFPSTPEVFIGRNGEIEDLRKLIEKRQKVLITAIGGIGKTRLAIECARQWVKDGAFNRAVFINVETEQEANKRFMSLGKKLNENPEVVDVYEYFNKKCSGQTLFVLDNVEETNDIKNFLPPEDLENIKILATSQDSEYGLLFHPFNLNKLTEDKALGLVKALFNKYQEEYGKNGNSRANLLYIRKKDIPVIQELMKELDGHPLALLHATALCVDSIIYNGEDDLSQYLNTYLKDLKKKISEGLPLQYKTGYNKTIIASISINVQKAIVNEHVRDFLFTMCFMNPTFIELKYFRNCGYFSEVQIKESKRTLLKHSIIHFRDDNSEDINVHRLVLFVCLTMLQNDNLEERIVDIIASMFFCDKQSFIYHGSILFQNTNLGKKDLAGLYMKVFKKSHFMSKLSARLQRIDLTVEDLEGWGVLQYCKFAEHDFWFKYFNESPEMIESKNLDVDWPTEIIENLNGNYGDLNRVMRTNTVINDLILLHFYAAFARDLSDFKYPIEVADIPESSKLFNIAIRNQNYLFGFDLLKRGAMYEDKDKALMCAVLGRDLKLIRTLIQEGADVSFSDDAGIGPIFLAIVTANDEILSELQKYGANIESALNVKDGIKNTALLSVIKGRFVASHDYPNKEIGFYHFNIDRSRTPKLNAVEWLIKYGADINCVDCKNNTPLMTAVQEHETDIAVKLIQSGADVNKTDDFGGTPLVLAKGHKFDGTFIKLLEERASICAPTPTTYDIQEPELFLSKYWKWRLTTCQEIQTHLEESQKNIKKLLLSTSDGPDSIHVLDRCISKILQIGRSNLEEAIDDLDFSSFAKILVDNLNRSINDAIAWHHQVLSRYDVREVLEILAELIFETRFELPANLFHLYDKYIDIKFENHAFRTEKTSENNETEDQLDAVRRVHQELAVRLLFPEEKSLLGLEELKKFKVNYKNLVRIGILTFKDGQLMYLNSSVAQYFLSEYLISNFNSEVVQTMFLQRVLIECEFYLTRQFCDSQLELFFENEELMHNKSDEGHKQLDSLKRNRFIILAGVELTDKVKETVRLSLQGDRDFLLLNRVEDEGRAHIIKYILNKFESDLGILVSLIQQADERTTYFTIAISERTETFKTLLYFMIENLDRDTFFLALTRLLYYFSSRGKTKSLTVFLDCLKEKLYPKNLNHLLNQTKRYRGTLQTVLHVLAHNSDSEVTKIFFDFLKENLSQENLGHLLQQTTEYKDTVLHTLSQNVNSEIFEAFLDFLRQNLNQEDLNRSLLQANVSNRTILHYISQFCNTQNIQICLNFLKKNLNQEDLKVLWEKRDYGGKYAVDTAELYPENRKILLNFAKDNNLPFACPWWFQWSK